MKIVRYFLISILVLGSLFAAAYFIKTNSKSIKSYETESPFITSIQRKTVVTGKVIPEDEVEIKPQVSGIVDKIFVEEGDIIKAGDLLAKVQIVPDESSLNSAQGRVNNAKIVLANARLDFERNQKLYAKEIISQRDFESSELGFNQAQQELKIAKSNLQIIKEGSVGGARTANTNIRATIAGTVLEIPIEEGDQVTESNTFNNGTTIASVADLNKMIFEGEVDEAEVGKLYIDMPLQVNLGAIQGRVFEAKLKFISPKGNEDQGAVKFTIEGDVYLEDVFVRAGYSANASIILDSKDSILALPESVIQFDRKTEEPYVEIKNKDGSFERSEIETGISDGINVEILSGVDKGDEIKVWNKTEPKKLGEDDEDN